MNLGPHLILITCSFSSRPLIHFTCQYQTPPVIRKFMNHAKHTSCSIIYISFIIQSYSAKTDHSGTTDIQIQYGLAQHLAQAGGSRSGEPPPSPRREHKSKSMSNAGSRLSEIPLAWASCLLAQKLSESPGDLSCKKNLGELPVSSRLGEMDSLGRN